MTDFLLELRSEEIPARMQDKAREDLARLFLAELDKAGLKAGEVVTYATPRRLALIARDLPVETAAVAEEIKGPRVGAPPQALEGFLRKTGLTREQLVERDGVLFAVIDRPGQSTSRVLTDAIAHIVRHMPWPKSMRWGEASISTESARWVRPLHGIVALFGEDVVPCKIVGVTSGATTLGHRFHHPGAITIGSASDYAEKLRACHVIVDQDERRAIIRERAAALAAEARLVLVDDEGLVAENAGLTEWPVPLLGRFDAAFLDVPPEVIQLTARVNQKYFVCKTPLPGREGLGVGPETHGRASKDQPTPDPSLPGRGGELANAFICTANIDAADGGAKIVEGNRKVLAARLSDARFFYETDLKVPLEEQARKLEKIVFHEKLGTVADKVERVAKLARWLVEEGIVSPSPLRGEGRGEGQSQATPSPHGPSPDLAALGHPLPGGERERLAALAERAARLCKADLVTGMVGEFPELQGVMGGYYAAAQGEDPTVAAAIRDHYKPVGAGDDVPTDPVTVAVSLADKLDTIVSFFAIDERPTGSKDPFALRRSAIGIISQIIRNGLRFDLGELANFAAEQIFDHLQPVADSVPLMRQTAELAKKGIIGRELAKDLIFSAPDAEAELLTNRSNKIFFVEIAVVNFIRERLEVQQRDAGVKPDFLRAIFSIRDQDDLVSDMSRVRALQAFVGTGDGANLLAGYKRAANILRKEGWTTDTPLPAREGLGVGAERSEAPAAAVERDPAGRAPTPDPSLQGRGEYVSESAEAALIAALDAAEPAAADAVAREDFEAAMAALATLRAPIDAFFETVTVKDSDPAKRAARLALLARVRDAVHNVADFSKIEG